MEVLILVAERGGPTMLARIGLMRALNRAKPGPGADHGARKSRSTTGHTVMRTMLIIFASLAAGTPSIAGPASPISYDYPWCVYGEELGYSGDCSYQTREQCLASASGRWNTYCDVNPRVLFEQQQGVRQQSLQQQSVQQRRALRRH